MESKLLLLALVIAISISQIDSLQCYVCIPPKFKGTQAPDCEFDAHKWGVLETCPPQDDVCLSAVQSFEGVEVHTRECGQMKGGYVDIRDDCTHELTGKTHGYVCYCKEDGCNKGLEHNAATTSKATGALALLIPVLSYYLSK